MSLQRIELILLFCFCTTWIAAQDKPLDNSEIIKLTRLDMGDDIIIAKIKAAKEVKFDTGTEALVALRQAGVSKPVITAMVSRSSASPEKPQLPTGKDVKDVRVTLQTNNGPIELKGIFGIHKTQTAMFSLSQWVQFNDTAAKIRTPDLRPSILVACDRDPRGVWWFVRTTVYRKGGEEYRYFDLEGGGAFSMTWSGSPERGSIVNVGATEEKPGLWRLTPLKDLKPGEYGLFSGQTSLFGALGPGEGQAILFDFGIEK